MKHLVLLLVCLVCLAGCQSSDFQAEFVIEGQPAPFSGYNIGPDLYVLQGEPCPVTGGLVWLKHLDPNDIFKQ